MRDLGSLNSNEIRILELLKKRGKIDGKTISKLTRIPEFTVRNLLDSLAKRGFVKEGEGKFEITPAGSNVLSRIRL